MHCQNLYKFTRILTKKIFAKYLTADGCFVKTNTTNCDDNNNSMFPITRAFAFTRQPMNFLLKHQSNPFAQQLGLCMSTNVLICEKIEDEPAYCPDRQELFQISRPCKNSHCFEKVVHLLNIIQDYFPIRDSKRLECVKKCFLKEEILLHYQNSRFFRTYANSNKMSGPLHVRINECILD